MCGRIGALVLLIYVHVITGNDVIKDGKFQEKLIQFMIDHKVESAHIRVSQHGKNLYTHKLVLKDDLEDHSADKINGGAQEMDPLEEHRSGVHNVEVHPAQGPIPTLEFGHVITSLAVLTLIRDGAVKYEQPVFGKAGLLQGPDSPDERMEQVTLLDVIQQTVGWGVRDMSWSERVGQSDWSAQSERSILERALSHRMMWTPGAAYNYSVLNDHLLRRIIEKQSGQDYQTYVTEQVLHPLKLHQTQLTKTGAPPLTDFTMPLLPSLWITNLHDLVRLLTTINDSRNVLNVDLGVMYRRPGLPYPQDTKHWHSPSFILDKNGRYWGESVTSNGHYLFVLNTGSLLSGNEDDRQIMLVFYGKCREHRHFKPLLEKMMKESFLE